MNVTINDINLALPSGATLLQALEVKDIKPQGIATALNGTVIPASKRESTTLKDGDKIVIIKAFYGG
ncbi:sulfur carrier protein ThiS [Duncaniella freteri]|uniref:sulfur carrier protein ThiS n=1 Tax=Duncaniella freteri TaxID=2530391 RepID=UPI0025A19861|nr:sulfur carrier protein ThiS [Duncaniella freteri]